jgi:hypothetical protein
VLKLGPQKSVLPPLPEDARPRSSQSLSRPLSFSTDCVFGSLSCTPRHATEAQTSREKGKES